MQMPNKLYDVLKWIALIGLPMVGVVYPGLAEIWGFPFGDEITRTVALIETGLGILLGISTVGYNKTNKQTES